MDTQTSQASGLRKPNPNRLSKLPTPGSSLPAPTQHIRPTSPVRSQQSIKLPAVSPSKPSLQRPSASTKSSVGGSRGLARPQSTIVTAKDAASMRPLTPVDRQPLSSLGRPQSRQGTGIARPPSTLGSAYQYRKFGARHPSDEENKIQQTDSSDPDSSPTSSKDGNAVGSNMPRKSRPSLSDRTVESLSYVPPSPASTRRQSGFYGAPGTPASRPPPSASGRAVRSSSIAGPTSPTKRPVSSYGLPTPSKGGFGSGIPGASHTANTSVSRNTATPGKAARPQSSTAIRPATANSHARSKTVAAKPGQPPSAATSKPGVTKPALAPPRAASLKQPSITPRPLKRTTPAPQPTPKLEVESEGEENRRTSNSTSAALREQIAKAKAAHKEAMTKAKAAANERSAVEFNADSIDDPFNQAPRDGKGLLRKRVDDARKDGRLNIAAMKLREIPEEVLKMYDTEAMQASSVPWSECVDLVKLNAADNEFDKIPDSVFPDAVPSESIAADCDAPKGNQFGGLETLDLHGNMLCSLPTGIRNLARLTSINFSRNKLENSALEIISQVSTLRDLNLGFNDLTKELPACIGQLKKLDSLQIQGNKLTSLPSAIRDLSSLRILNMSDNRLPSVPLDLMTGLPLVELHAANNGLMGSLFPMSVSGLPRLQILDVANNSLAALSFAPTLHLPALQRLDVSNNRLSILPPVGRWTGLTALLVEDNGLEELPAGFTDLESLRTANFIGNNLRELDEAIARMDSLESLLVAGNPLRDKKFLTMGAQQIKMDLARREEVSKGFDEAFMKRPSATLDASA